MALRVITPAQVTDLVELASIKTRLGITDSSEDSNLEEFIEDVTSVFHEAEVFGRVLARQEYVEPFHPVKASYELCLGCNPIDPDSVSVEIDGEALEATDFEVRDAQAGILYRQAGWPCRHTSDEGDGIEVTYKGGFLIPASLTAKGVVCDWSAATDYVAGAWVRAVGTAQALRFECTTAGTSGGTEPTWPTTAGQTVTDGTAVWTARLAWELPREIRMLAGIAVRDLRDSADRPSGVTAEEGDTFRLTYSASSATSTGISPEILARLGSLRARYGR
jgi:hypothetical protein